MSLHRKVLKVTLVRLPLLFLDYFLLFFNAGIWFNVVDKRSEEKKTKNFNWKTVSIFFKGRVIDKNTIGKKTQRETLITGHLCYQAAAQVRPRVA